MPSVASVRTHISLALLNLLVLGGALLWARDPRETAVRIVPPPTPSPAPSATPIRLHVYVTGAVEASKVVALAPMARAEDAVSACGGFTTEADPALVNLAAPLSDGQHLHVPAKGEAPRAPLPGALAPASGVTAQGMASDGGRTVSDSGSVVNVNAATAAELESLPGVGPALAGRVVAFRDTNGPYATVDDLLAVSGIGAKTLARFRDRVVVR